MTGIRALGTIFLSIVELRQPEHGPIPSEAAPRPALRGVTSVLTVKNLCLVQNRQAVYSQKNKTKQFGLLSISDLADFGKKSAREEKEEQVMKPQLFLFFLP